MQLLLKLVSRKMSLPPDLMSCKQIWSPAATAGLVWLKLKPSPNCSTPGVILIKGNPFIDSLLKILPPIKIVQWAPSE